MSAIWYWMDNGNPQGPVTGQDLISLVQRGRIFPNTKVRKEGMSEWALASQVKGLFLPARQPEETPSTQATEASASDENLLPQGQCVDGKLTADSAPDLDDSHLFAVIGGVSGLLLGVVLGVAWLLIPFAFGPNFKLTELSLADLLDMASQEPIRLAIPIVLTVSLCTGGARFGLAVHRETQRNRRPDVSSGSISVPDPELISCPHCRATFDTPAIGRLKNVTCPSCMAPFVLTGTSHARRTDVAHASDSMSPAEAPLGLESSDNVRDARSFESQTATRPRRLAVKERDLKNQATFVAQCALITFAIGLFAPCFTVIPKLGGGFLEGIARLFAAEQFVPKSFSLIGGVWHLFSDGSIVLGTVVLVFSLIFPALKLWVVFAGLEDQPQTSGLLGVVESLGKLSMLDVLVIAVMVVSSKAFPGGSRILPNWGAYVFAAAVLLSMWATHLVSNLHRLRGASKEALSTASK